MCKCLEFICSTQHGPFLLTTRAKALVIYERRPKPISFLFFLLSPAESESFCCISQTGCQQSRLISKDDEQTDCKNNYDNNRPSQRQRQTSSVNFTETIRASPPHRKAKRKQPVMTFISHYIGDTAAPRPLLYTVLYKHILAGEPQTKACESAGLNKQLPPPEKQQLKERRKRGTQMTPRTTNRHKAFHPV